jgi:two-component system, NarL family, response regulator DesR
MLRGALAALLSIEADIELAHSLRLTEGTVRNYFSEAISKLHASSRFEAARIARNKGWL